MADDIYSHLICGGKLAYLELKDKIVFITLFASVLTMELSQTDRCYGRSAYC